MEPAPPRVFDRGMRIASALAICVLLASCGGGGGQSSGAKQVRAPVEAWLSSLSAGSKKGDNARACAYLTRDLQKAMDVQLRTRGEHATCKTYAANWTGRSTPPCRPGAHVT